MSPNGAAMSRMTLQEGLSGVRAWLQEKTAGGPYGCLTLRSGEVAAAWYGGGFHEGSLFEIGSIRKSFNRALVGQALERGEITLDLRAGETWPEIAEISGRSADRNLTLHQLMSGIQAAECANPGIPGPPYGYNWFTNTKRALWPSAPEDSFGHPGFGTFKPTEAPSRAYLWVCRRLAVVAALVADVRTGIAGDFLDVPNSLTSEWICRITEVFQ